MAFKEVTKGTFQGNKSKTNTVAMHRVKNTRSVKVIMSFDVVDSIGAPAYLTVSVGSGDHAGMVLLSTAKPKSTNRYKLGKQSSTSKQMSMTITDHKIGADAVEMPTSVTPVEYAVTDDGVVITLDPAWVAST